MVKAPVAVGLAVTMVMVVLAGCIADDEAPEDTGRVTGLTSVSVYEYRYTGDDAAVHGFPYGWMALLSAVGGDPVQVLVTPLGSAVGGPVDNETGWTPTTEPVLLLPQAPLLYLFQDPDPHGRNGTAEAGFTVEVLDVAGATTERGLFNRTLTWSDAGDGLQPGHRILGQTVGVWLNGTSFYTNIADLEADAEFPVGYDREDFSDAALTVYVWDRASSENPPGNRDNCWFPTITGFNRLLRNMAAGTTLVEFVAPEDAYTLPGRDAHPLYGDALVFMTTVNVIEGMTQTADLPPDPSGGCFDARNSLQYAVPNGSLPIPPIL